MKLFIFKLLDSINKNDLSQLKIISYNLNKISKKLYVKKLFNINTQTGGVDKIKQAEEALNSLNTITEQKVEQYQILSSFLPVFSMIKKILVNLEINDKNVETYNRVKEIIASIEEISTILKSELTEKN